MCRAAVEHPEGEVARYCPNASCPGRVLEGITHYASRGALDIRGLGQQRVAQLHEADLVHDVGDLYNLTVPGLEQLDGFASRAAQQLVEAIHASKGQPLSRLLFALGIRHVGAEGATLLARTFEHLDALTEASADAIGAIDGIGPTIAEAVVRYFKEPTTLNLIERLRAHGVSFEETAAERDAVLSGQTFVITGTLPTRSRTEIQTLIKQAGGRVTSSVSKNTTALIVGDDPGSKLGRAKKLGVELIDESAVLRRIAGLT